MEVSGVAWVEREAGNSKIQKLPHTFFELTPAEKVKYDSFRNKHSRLKNMVDASPTKMLGLKEREKREDGEREASEMFLDLVSPYFHKINLETTRSFTCYGKPRQTIVEVPAYVLFESGKPFNSAIKFNFCFSTENEDLSCESEIAHTHCQNYSGTIRPETFAVHELFESVIKGIKQDGVNFPMLSFSAFGGSLISFASTDFAVPLMTSIRTVLEKVEPESMKELTTLYREYINQAMNEESYTTKIRQKVFREAYENKLEEIIKGFQLLAHANSLIRD